MKRTKRILALLLAALLCFCCSSAVFAADGNGTPEPSAAIFGLEHTGGAIANVLGQALKLITLTDESRIKKAEPRKAAGQESDMALFTEKPEQTLFAETWRAVELSFESKKAYADPFGDVTLDLLLYGDGRLYTVPGFWDGSNTWRVRFVCPAAGTWQCKTVCSDETNAALHGRTAQVECAAYTGDLDIFKHGFVTTRYGEKYLTYEDGKPFYYLGDTHWGLMNEPADVVSVISAKRAGQGFTVYQSEPLDCAMNNAVTENVDDRSLEDFRVLDEKFAVISEAGLTHANSQFFWPLSGMSRLIDNHGGWTEPKLTGYLGTKKVQMPDLSDEAKAYLEKLSRYWVARYSAYPVIWTLGQEVDNDPYQNETSKWNAINNPYKYVAEYLNKYDPYDHPVTAHQESTGDTVAYGNGLGTGEVRMIYYLNGAPSAFRKVAAHTMYAAQWHPKNDKRDDYVSAKDFWYNGQGKPVINYEGRYCYLWTKNFGARCQGWASFLSGMSGASWGAHPTWLFNSSADMYGDTDDSVDLVRVEEKKEITWETALDMPSSYQLGYMRSFMEGLEWYNLIPRFNNWAYFVPSSNVYSYCASNKKNTEMVVYFYSFTDETVAERVNTRNNGGILTGTVGSLVPFGKYTYKWFDPISGKYSAEGTFRASALGTWYAGMRPNDTDYVLLIQKA